MFSDSDIMMMTLMIMMTMAMLQVVNYALKFWVCSMTMT